jgi:hypothetical protein
MCAPDGRFFQNARAIADVRPVFKEDRLAVRVRREDADGFRAAVASEADDSDRDGH